MKPGTQKEAAERCGVSEMVISRTLNGRVPHLEHAAAIAKGFGVTLDELLK
jgi:transcriptional regulator with XRE-family HTH domain